MNENNPEKCSNEEKAIETETSSEGLTLKEFVATTEPGPTWLVYPNRNPGTPGRSH